MLKTDQTEKVTGWVGPKKKSKTGRAGRAGELPGREISAHADLW